MIRISYIPMTDLKLLDQNPKQHDLGKLILSFQKYGFRDAPILDDEYKNIIAGNGRVMALSKMKASGMAPPLGIIVKNDDWLVPVQTGTKSSSPAEALSFAIDHNNLTLLGGSFDVSEIAKLWTTEYVSLLVNLANAGTFPVSVSGDDLDVLVNYREFIPTHESREAEDLTGFTAINIQVTSVEYFEDVIKSIRRLVEVHPTWQAKIR